MNIRKHAATLAAALVIGAGIVGLSADYAHAVLKDPGPTVYCYAENADGSREHVLPEYTYYDRMTNENMTCGEDGELKTRTMGPATIPRLPGWGLNAE